MHREDAKPIHLTPGKLCVAIALLSLLLFIILRIEFLAILASLFISLYLTSFWLGYVSINGLRANIQVSEDRIRAGQRLKSYLALYNRNRFLPIFYPLVEVIESGSSRIQRFHLPQCLGPKKEIQIPIYPILSDRGHQSLQLRYGLSYFPIRLAEFAIPLSKKHSQTIVWPRLPNNQDEPPLRKPRSEDQDQGPKPTLQNQTSYPSHIREYLPGDPKRSISWRLSAKLDKLLVAERNAHPTRKYILVLDTTEPGWRSINRFERMLSSLSQLIGDFLRQHRLHSIILNGKHYPLTTRKQYIRFMDALSVSSPKDFSIKFEPRKGFHYLYVKPDPNRRFRLVERKGGVPTYI